MKNRKKLIFVFSLLAFGCTKNNVADPEEPLESYNTITATFDDEGTRTYLDIDGETPLWSVGDVIKVMNGTTSQNVTLASTGSASTTVGIIGSNGRSFTFQVPTTGWETIYAVYPASCAKGTVSAGSININIPTVQNGTFASANICAAKSSTTSLRFKNATSIAMIAPTSATTIPNDRIIFVAGGMDIAGDFGITFDGDGKISSVTTVPNGKNYKSINGTIPLQTASYYAFAPCDFTETTNVTLSVRKDGSENYASKIYSRSSSQDFVINKIYNFKPTFSNADYDTKILPGEFSVSSSEKIRFSTGNLYAKRDNTSSPWHWGCYNEQYEINSIPTSDGNRNSISDDCEIDLFCWGYNPTNSTDPNDYTTNYSFTDWGGCVGGGWFTLSRAQWEYLLTGPRILVNELPYGTAVVNGRSGLVLLPDNWDGSIAFYYGLNPWFFNIPLSSWKDTYEPAGCVFLPAAGFRNNDASPYNIFNVNLHGNYWSTTENSGNYAFYLYISNNSSEITVSTNNNEQKRFGHSVRLVKHVR